MGVAVRAQSQQPQPQHDGLLVSDDTKLGGQGRVSETHLSKEGLEVPPQIASFFPTHETSLLTSVQLSCPQQLGITRLAKAPTKKWLATSWTGVRTGDPRVRSPSPYPFGYSDIPSSFVTCNSAVAFARKVLFLCSNHRNFDKQQLPIVKFLSEKYKNNLMVTTLFYI